MYFKLCNSDFFKTGKNIYCVAQICSQERGRALVLDFVRNELIKAYTAIAVIQHNDKQGVY